MTDMTISKLIKNLQKIQKEFGDIPVYKEYDGERIDFKLTVHTVTKEYNESWRILFGLDIDDRYLLID